MKQAMEHYLNGEYSCCRDSLLKLLDKINNPRQKGTTQLNIAYCEYKLSLYRKCIKSAESASRLLEGDSLKSYGIMARAYHKMGKTEDCNRVISTGLRLVDSADVMDLETLVEFKQLAVELTSPSSIASDNQSSTNEFNRNKEDTRFSNDVSTIITSSISTKKSLLALHTKYVRPIEAIYSRNLLDKVRSNLSQASGVSEIDDIVAVGYLNVNTGNLEQAIKLFRSLNDIHSDIPAAYIGLGSALALAGRLTEADQAFTSAVGIAPHIADAWKRRGLTRAAENRLVEAFEDMVTACALEPDDDDAHLQRGLILARLSLFQLSKEAFDQAKICGGSSAQLYNCEGMSLVQLGDMDGAVDAYKRALAIDGAFLEAQVNLGRAYKEMGEVDSALEAYSTAIGMNSDNKIPVLRMRGQLLYASGRLKECISDLSAALSVDSEDKDAMLFLGLAHHASGNLPQALSFYERILSIDPGHHCWYLIQTAKLLNSELDTNLMLVNFDKLLDPRIKDGLCKQSDWRITMAEYKPRVKPINDQPCSDSIDIDLTAVVDAAVQCSAILQLNCRGFIPNRRQRVMFGMASFQISRLLSAQSIAIAQGTCITVNNQTSSQIFEDVIGEHSLCWRDLVDVGVRWRQAVEPNDNVFWIDLFPRKSFEDGFGLTTPMLNGEMHTVRYYCYFEKGFTRMKHILVSDKAYFNASSSKSNLDGRALSLVSASNTLENLYEAIGEDFYVVTTCTSNGSSGKITTEGTRITVLKKLAGFEFTIRTPGTPPRWKWFDEEMRHCFHTLISALNKDSGSEVLDRALSFFYYFVNFAPLSRGTASIAYMILNAACLSSTGQFISEQLPNGIQLDWEAILADSERDFVALAKSYLQLTKLKGVHEINAAASEVRSYKAIFAALNSV